MNRVSAIISLLFVTSHGKESNRKVSKVTGSPDVIQIETTDSTSNSSCCATLTLMRVLGIDCGGEFTGYGVVEMHDSGKLSCLSCGAIKLSTRDSLPLRLSRIYMHLGAIISEHQPDQVAIEDVFYALNVKSALKLGQVRGVAMLAAASAGLEVAEYSPLTIKSSVVGYGRAEKEQVQHMVTRLLALPAPPEPMDASDALAIAICHLHTSGTLNRQRAVGR